ncbi:MAG: NUDIX domain-containing protein [Elusimicrobia bacterium]|nr:NUDIX domain-containing protein [Elusimicrobiota bacterium]
MPARNKNHCFVVILPVARKRILMQLRDPKPRIPYPGHWGFFGGAVHAKEKAQKAAARELAEEIGYRPVVLHPLGCKTVPDLGNITIFSYCCRLDVPLKALRLTEGVDLGLKTVKDALSRSAYSQKMRRRFPVTPSHFITDTMRQAIDCIEAAERLRQSRTSN